MPLPTVDTAKTHEIAQGLATILADTYNLYITTQGAHWNVEGANFHSLHAMFMEQYEALALAIDAIAERIRSLGYYAPGTPKKLIALTTLDQPDEVRGNEQMLNFLVKGHESINKRVHEIRALAADIGDEATVDLMNARQDFHEETLWMLKSTLGKGSQEL